MDSIPRYARCEAAEQAARAPRVAADNDLRHFGRVPVKTGDLEVVDLAAVVAFAVDELVVEDAEGEIDVGGLAQPWPPCVTNMSGMAEIEIARMITKYRMPRVFASRPFTFVPM